jgi:hypothetical protein
MISGKASLRGRLSCFWPFGARWFNPSSVDHPVRSRDKGLVRCARAKGSRPLRYPSLERANARTASIQTGAYRTEGLGEWPSAGPWHRTLPIQIHPGTWIVILRCVLVWGQQPDGSDISQGLCLIPPGSPCVGVTIQRAQYLHRLLFMAGCRKACSRYKLDPLHRGRPSTSGKRRSCICMDSIQWSTSVQRPMRSSALRVSCTSFRPFKDGSLRPHIPPVSCPFRLTIVHPPFRPSVPPCRFVSYALHRSRFGPCSFPGIEWILCSILNSIYLPFGRRPMTAMEIGLHEAILNNLRSMTACERRLALIHTPCCQRSCLWSLSWWMAYGAMLGLEGPELDQRLLVLQALHAS